MLLPMTEDLLRYDLIIEAALRNVVREVLENVAKSGLPGEHHFYVTFLTHFAGVEIPDYLKKQYPEEMTIVLQYQFFGLKIDAEALIVTLSFNNVKERLRVPLEAITTFADPSVNFALQFQSGAYEEDEEGEDVEIEDHAAAPKSSNSDRKEGGEEKAKGKSAKPKGGGDKDKDKKKGEVISLDMFRKK
ncbi:MAG TPA: ClpXP protease specificity-enhancing factor SspB [Alphaproteobacteria bacterium]|nr:ClpXP protease specificity-enhancing factor SspB [Alphaproteobacteria bacterium]